MRIAIITGASSGMGREYVRVVDQRGFDQIWAIARRRERLEELARECETPVVPIPLDLSLPQSIDELGAHLKAAREQDGDFSVGLLVSCAGFAKLGTFAEVTREETDKMIAVNCTAMVDITQLVVPYMTSGSRILELVSMASFQPLPHLNIYAATKAFMLSYTRSLRWELAGTGIHATAVCPGWVRTEFQKVSEDTRANKAVRHQQPSISPHRVAVWSLFVNRINFPVATCGIYSWATRVFSKFIPNPIVMALWELIRRI